MPDFSLVVATKHRTTEVARLIRSIDDQAGADYELIIVDQNEDERLHAIIQDCANRERILHVKSRTGVSRARNVGINLAQGYLISFPDDDCWYPPGVLKEVKSWFNSNRAYDVLSLAVRDEVGECIGNRWFFESCDLNLVNIFRTSAGPSFFIRSTASTRGARFDEGIGPGADTQYLAGEDTDYILELMKKGARGRYEAKWHIGHPRKDIKTANVSDERIHNYGKGAGFVQQKHRLAWLWVALVAFDFGRAIYCVARGKIKQGHLLYQHGRGLVAGFIAPRSQFESQGRI
jgi:glycosyltransferase involved in cell wall biosynthesis